MNSSIYRGSVEPKRRRSWELISSRYQIKVREIRYEILSGVELASDWNEMG
jgi:hypothetical protein